MPAKDLGSKFTCFKCSTKFYDMKKPDPVCPKCGSDQRESPANKPAEKGRGRLAAVPRVVEPIEPVAPVAEARRGSIPAVTHVDGSARVQTVARGDHPRFWGLLDRFGTLTGCPVLVNTSFNVRGEPIVCTPSEAYVCFMRTRIDALVIGFQ